MSSFRAENVKLAILFDNTMEDSSHFVLALEAKLLAWARPNLSLVAKDVPGTPAYIWAECSIVKFPSALNASRRETIHSAATKLGLLHKSTGGKNDR